MKILVGISDGVDSAYAAKKLMEEGHFVEGAMLRMHEYTELSEGKIAAENIGIPLHVVDCTVAFDNIIRKNFVEEYLAGRTPNPCILCNQLVKFRYLFDYAMDNGFDAIATGHYAKVVEIRENGDVRYALSVATDSRKDQSYMLYRLPQEILAKLILPLGDCVKEDVRAAASYRGIAAADRPDSQEICFLSNGNYREYIEFVAGKCPEGNFVSDDGRILGKHKGIIHYTVGQRKGLGISLGERAFVTGIDPRDNTVTLSPAHRGSFHVRLRDMVYSGIEGLEEAAYFDLSAKIRYGASFVECTAASHDDGSVVLDFRSPVKAAPGQSAVLYRDGVVMCGGFIECAF